VCYISLDYLSGWQRFAGISELLYVVFHLDAISLVMRQNLFPSPYRWLCQRSKLRVKRQLPTDLSIRAALMLDN